MSNSPSKTEVDPYSIPGGMLCTICGLRYYSKSMGGPGICPSCDCGNFGKPVVDAQRKEIERLRAALSMDQPWPLPDVLAKLIEATEHLLKHHDCDAHGHEEYRAAADYGQALLLVLRTAPESRDG